MPRVAYQFIYSTLHHLCEPAGLFDSNSPSPPSALFLRFFFCFPLQQSVQLGPPRRLFSASRVPFFFPRGVSCCRALSLAARLAVASAKRISISRETRLGLRLRKRRRHLFAYKDSLLSVSRFLTRSRETGSSRLVKKS